MQKSLFSVLLLFVFVLLQACNSDQTGNDANDETQKAIKTSNQVVEQDSVPSNNLTSRIDSAALSQQLGGANIRVTPVEQKESDKFGLSEPEKRALWNEKMNERMKEVMSVFAREYTNGTFKQKLKTTPSGLQYMMLEKGNGEKVPPGRVAYIHNFITLPNGETIEANYNHKEPLRLRLDGKSTIAGMEEAIKMMDINSNYLFVIPPGLAYGKAGNPPLIPSNSELLVYMTLNGYE